MVRLQVWQTVSNLLFGPLAKTGKARIVYKSNRKRYAKGKLNVRLAGLGKIGIARRQLN